MSLLKIPFILVSAIGVHVSLNSPPRLPESEVKIVPSGFLESFVRWFVGLRGLQLMKIGIWAVSSVEVASILTMHVDPSHFPEGIYGARALQHLLALHSTPITPTFLAGSLAITIGGALRLYCISMLGKVWSFQLSVRKEQRLVTSGPYSVVRHPSYTGYLLQYVGFVIMYGSQGSWMRQSGILHVPFLRVLAAIVFFMFTAGALVAISRSPVEDEMLQRALGEQWEIWAKKVKYRLLPGVY
ncbi:hypothetical protein CY34DRAFT_85882 [Suillus luteus UH-Slu-Lm8-n1]|uniref:Protein-S-isoprenylcysteine O-methyltransferase n=1 Tax=Suillus luteus UH-Slu-Lm8-n1 TaxID=930992 RepID=A0A0D0AH68_9AGAM|nr:hypothetical protein CY34DRAFT_85882 [Suillus luteus UH-Slu-Lm8-n1]